MDEIKKVTVIMSIAFALYSSQVFSAGPWVEGRESYWTATNQHELAFRGGYDFDNSAGVMLTNAYNTGTYDQLKHSWNELEGWYPFWSSADFAVMGGGIVNENTEGSGGAAYFDFRYFASQKLNFVLRTRYNYRNYDSITIDGGEQANNTGEFHIGVSYIIDPDWSYYIEPTYIQQAANFHSDNDRTYHWEVNNVLTYTGFHHWVPYLEAGWMDRVVSENAENYRFRIGLRYNF